VFCEQLEQKLNRVQRGERLAVLYLDLDYLKQVNDTLGHPAGDKLLMGVADRLRGCVRDVDLVELGVLFAMDDFGTGYSSLSYLLSFPFHKIKIDKCFIAALSDKNKSHAIVRAITDLARSLKLRATAEGVETAQQLQQVRLLGCTEMQGYLLSPPRPAAERLQFFTPRTEYADNLIAVNASADRKNGKMCGIRPDLVCGHRMTGRECDVLMGIIAGDTSKESARHLNISPRTIELHRGRIKKKFEVKNSADLVRMMLTTGCSPSRPKAAFRYIRVA
jgi:predicted signal transduction protein with EAL and GGDEF domain/DNA-binding CsgD family transcriptional regulator